MSGMLFHGKSFKQEAYKGEDGKQHTELNVVDGDFIGMTNTTWSKLISMCEAQGIPRACWPVYKNSTDVPLQDIYEKNILLQANRHKLTEDFVESSEWLQKIAVFLFNGEMIAFVTM